MKPDKRSDLALAVPAGGLFVELGVAAGSFSDEVLSANPDMRFIGIDKWNDHHDLREMDEAWRKVLKHGKRGELRRMQFSDAVHQFEDGSIDVVFIDGYAHTGQDGGQTLADWFPKVRPGGILAGHDYCSQYPETIEAVDHFVEILQSEGSLIELEIISDSPYDSWFIRKPDQ